DQARRLSPGIVPYRSSARDRNGRWEARHRGVPGNVRTHEATGFEKPRMGNGPRSPCSRLSRSQRLVENPAILSACRSLGGIRLVAGCGEEAAQEFAVGEVPEPDLAVPAPRGDGLAVA